jgi:hypothetical protein
MSCVGGGRALTLREHHTFGDVKRRKLSGQETGGQEGRDCACPLPTTLTAAHTQDVEAGRIPLGTARQIRAAAILSLAVHRNENKPNNSGMIKNNYIPTAVMMVPGMGSCFGS